MQSVVVSGGVWWCSFVLEGIHLKHDVFIAREMFWRANFTHNRSLMDERAGLLLTYTTKIPSSDTTLSIHIM